MRVPRLIAALLITIFAAPALALGAGVQVGGSPGSGAVSVCVLPLLDYLRLTADNASYYPDSCGGVLVLDRGGHEALLHGATRVEDDIVLEDHTSRSLTIIPPACTPLDRAQRIGRAWAEKVGPGWRVTVLLPPCPTGQMGEWSTYRTAQAVARAATGAGAWHAKVRVTDYGGRLGLLEAHLELEGPHAPPAGAIVEGLHDRPVCAPLVLILETPEGARDGGGPPASVVLTVAVAVVGLACLAATRLRCAEPM